MSTDGARILVVDDERQIRRMLQTSLSGHGYQVLEAANGGDALVIAADRRPDIILLDLGLPDIDGVEVTRRLRQWSETPIIVLSVRENEGDKVQALDAGADDYLTKPFGMSELLARIRVTLRHYNPGQHEPIFQRAGLVVDFGRRLVRLNDNEVSLTPTEYDLLRLLVQQEGKVLTHRQLLKQVWGEAYEFQTHLLQVNISNLRKKIEPDPNIPRFIMTESGVGYRFRIET
ncbi:MAG: response regulator [Chloroflexi bacterium]|nr:response regulator [Anaerolineaceae bacterium]NMB90519.1 response regulator [Chloroflexota bacterium]